MMAGVLPHGQTTIIPVGLAEMNDAVSTGQPLTVPGLDVDRIAGRRAECSRAETPHGGRWGAQR